MNEFDGMKDDLLSRIERGLKHGIAEGANSLDLYLIKYNELSINMDAGIITAQRGGTIGVGCRCVLDKRIGFASASGITDSAVDFAIESAIVGAKINQPDDRWESFIQNPNSGKDGIIDTSVLDLSSEEAVLGADTIFQEAKNFDPRITSVSGGVYVGYGAFAVGNSDGIAKASATTGTFGQSYITAVENGKTKTGFDYIMDRGVPSFDGIGTKGAEKAIKLLNSTPLGKSEQSKFIFDPIAAGQFIKTALSNSVNGKSVVEGRSSFADRIGDQVGVKDLDIYDDGQILEDPNVQAIDGEGYPRTTTPIIEKGVLKTFIFDNYNAKSYGTESTGNANRGGPQSYESLPTVSPTTISVTPGSKDLDGLIAEIGNGILVTDFLMGMMHSNLISGDFSIVSPSSFVIENGEVKHPVEAVTIAGNLYSAFNHIISFGNENQLTFMGKVPSIAFDGFTVSG
ncbi:MAG: TldD/PmbA family protein [Candidatus Hodarchaeales archaeon]|jgi:PmbA protein